MLPPSHSIIKLLKTNQSFILYGQKSCGKTTYIKARLQEAQIRHIDFNCTLAEKKPNFLWLINVELNKLLTCSEKQFERLGKPNNLESWIGEIKKLVNSSQQIIELLDGLYIFMDNIEELRLSQAFLPAFYTACQKQFPFRFSFIFCGINFGKREYTLEQPFRSMISFCMPKPTEQYSQIINAEVTTAVVAGLGNSKMKQKEKEEEIKKLVKNFSIQIKAAFDNIQFNLSKIKTISRVIVNTILPLLEDQPSKSLVKMIHTNKLKEYMQKIIEHGPMFDYQFKRKVDSNDTVDLTLQYYPNLILTSIHLADYYAEKDDKRRFHDYKSRTNSKNKELKRSDFKIGRHPLQRIIAISQAIESQAKENDKQHLQPHHSLDYYSSFQYLSSIGRIKFSGKVGYHSKVSGNAKEEEAMAFMKRYDLEYSQFMAS